MDDIRRLVTASAQEVHCASSVEQVQSRWGDASLVLLGPDQVPSVRSAALPKRERVVVVAHSGAVDTVWREAMSVGAAHVAQLPEDEDWVADQLAQIAIEKGRKGVVAAFIGGSGGVGCSSFVAACGSAAVQVGESPVVVDLDPTGCGLDLILGSDEPQSGVRWAELYRVSGRIPGKSLVDGLPSVSDIPVLSWGENERRLPSNEALGIVVDSLRTSFDLVLLDLPRGSHDVANAVLPRADVAVFMARAGVIGSLAAQRSATWLLDAHRTVDLLVRPQFGPAAEASDVRDLGKLMGIDPLLIIPDCKDLTGDLEAGRPPGSSAKSKLGQAARDYVRGLDQLRDEC